MIFLVISKNNDEYLNYNMAEQFVKKYLLDQKAAFFENYRIALNSQDVDAVHDMRVSVKRLDTTIRMLNFRESANFRLKKCFRPIRFVYKQFGPIRDFQVLSILLSKYQDEMGIELGSLTQKCKLRIKQEIKRFHGFFSFYKYHGIKRTFKLIEFYLDVKESSELGPKILSYKKDRDELLKIYSDKSNKKHNLHEARKMIKDISYLMEMSESEMPDFASELKLYKELGSLLGTWHDRDVLYDYLKKQRKIDELKNVDFEKIFSTISKEKTELESKYFSLIGL